MCFVIVSFFVCVYAAMSFCLFVTLSSNVPHALWRIGRSTISFDMVYTCTYITQHNNFWTRTNNIPSDILSSPSHISTMVGFFSSSSSPR